MPARPGSEDDYHTAVVKSLGLEEAEALHVLGECEALRQFFDTLYGESSLPSSWKRIRPIAPGVRATLSRLAATRQR